MEEKNPFVLNVYAGPQYFCDREQETDRIINAIKNRRNLTLMSYRRLGKSGLVKHVFYQLRKEKGLKLFYVDTLFPQPYFFQPKNRQISLAE